MFKKVLFAVLWFPLVIIEMPAALISVLVTILGRFIFGWTDGKDEYNDFLEIKTNGWAILKSCLKFDD